MTVTAHQKLEHLEMLTSARQANLFALTTSAPWHQVISPGYLDRFAEHGLRRHDRIMVTANAYAREADYAWLVVLSNEAGNVTAKLWPICQMTDSKL